MLLIKLLIPDILKKRIAKENTTTTTFQEEEEEEEWSPRSQASLWKWKRNKQIINEEGGKGGGGAKQLTPLLGNCVTKKKDSIN